MGFKRRTLIAAGRLAEQALGGQAADQAAQSGGQARPLLGRQRAQDPGLPGLPGGPDPGGHYPALRGQVQPHVALVFLIPAAADPALALQAGREPAAPCSSPARAARPAHPGRCRGPRPARSAPGPRTGRPRRRAGSSPGLPSDRGSPPAAAGAAIPAGPVFPGLRARASLEARPGRVTAGLGTVGRTGRRAGIAGQGRAHHPEQLREQPFQFRIIHGLANHDHSCTAQLGRWYSRRVTVAPYNSGSCPRWSGHRIGSAA